MHELPITQQLLNLVLKEANKQKAKKVTSIHIKLGALSSFVDDSINFYWHQIAKDTIAQNAQIKITRTPTHLKCYQCSTTLIVKKPTDKCPQCGSQKIVILDGDELILDSLKII